MSRLSPDIWARLAVERVHGESLWARRAAPDVTERLIAGLDGEGLRHLLVLLKSDERELHDRQSRGLDVVTRELKVPPHETGRYLDITCHDAAGHEAFDVIGGELADRLALSNEPAPEVVARIVARWRRFWGQVPTQLLSREEQLGLFAELWFLSVWLVPKVGTSAAVNRWRGPNGSRHDFEWVGRSVEVKATTSSLGRIHHINGIDQLAPPENGNLLFFSLRLREEGGATNTLPVLVAGCRELLKAEDDALEQFEHTLAKSRYADAHELDYGALRLRVIEEALFRVEADFPRVTAETFSAEVPTGVSALQYQVDLNGFSHLLLATSPLLVTELK